MPFYCVSLFRIEGYRSAALLRRGPTGWIDRPTRWLATETVTVTVFDTRTVTVRVRYVRLSCLESLRQREDHADVRSKATPRWCPRLARLIT
jgi:hypothetical protein